MLLHVRVKTFTCLDRENFTLDVGGPGICWLQGSDLLLYSISAKCPPEIYGSCSHQEYARTVVLPYFSIRALGVTIQQLSPGRRVMRQTRHEICHARDEAMPMDPHSSFVFCGYTLSGVYISTNCGI